MNNTRPLVPLAFGGGHLANRREVEEENQVTNCGIRKNEESHWVFRRSGGEMLVSWGSPYPPALKDPFFPYASIVPQDQEIDRSHFTLFHGNW